VPAAGRYRKRRIRSASVAFKSAGVALAADIWVNLFLEIAADGFRTASKHNLTRHPMRRLYLPVCTRVIRESGLCNASD
jgi:hypothetical protein